MDTKWKRFRYGTEDTNPSWSFYGTAASLSFTLIFCGAAGRDDYWWIVSCGFTILSVIFLAYLNIQMGNGKEEPVPVRLLDGKWPDLWLAFLSYMAYLNHWRLWRRYSIAVNRVFDRIGWIGEFLFLFIFLVFSTALVAGVFVFLTMSLTRHLCKNKLMKTLFFYRLAGKIRQEKRKLEERQADLAAQGKSVRIWRRRRFCFLGIEFALVSIALLFLGAGCGEEELAFLVFVAAAGFIAVDFWFVMHTAREIGVLVDEIQELSENDIRTKEPILPKKSLFRSSEEQLLAVQRVKKESVEKQLKSERMKVDLITNVSHDLKTPLTAMVGCIDLLAKTEGLPQEAKDYVALLSVKAVRLREMIQDVFDMAKATSGGQDLHMERLDMARLLRQTAADMQERMDASGLIFRMKLGEEELPFMGDGKKLYRVYQNLLENTLKYSMAGSRVYIEAKEKEGKILTSIKNTSDCEMEFDADEVVERFTRGDKSRSTEGNGLGLAIAKSFTIACGGEFKVTIDGDLFKVETVFVKESHGA